MKRAGNLIQSVADINNLYHAFRKASRFKECKPQVQAYKSNLYPNLKKLQSEIVSGNSEIGNYTYFTIYDPKKRTICAASFPERVLHHALMNICHPHFERFQIFDSYATRLNKGTYKAITRAAYFCKTYKFYLKLDIRKYFDSIDQNVLKKQLSLVFKDSQVLEHLYRIINSYAVSDGKGLPIGNLTSQYFANHYLSKFDQYIKEILKVNAYVRYMDDMVLWANTATELNQIYKSIVNFMENELFLQLKPTILNTSNHGLCFLSYRIFDTHIELQQKSKVRFLNKIKTYTYNHCCPIKNQRGKK